MRIYQCLLEEQPLGQLNSKVAARYRTLRRGVGPLVLLAALGCAQASNLMDPAGPRFAADYAPARVSKGGTGPIRVVSFNIRYAQEIARATEILRRAAPGGGGQEANHGILGNAGDPVGPGRGRDNR
jgi:hypothetical protein